MNDASGDADWDALSWVFPPSRTFSYARDKDKSSAENEYASSRIRSVDGNDEGLSSADQSDEEYKHAMYGECSEISNRSGKSLRANLFLQYLSVY